MKNRTFIECGICKEKYKCNLNQSPQQKAKELGMVILKFEDLKARYCEEIYVCHKCFDSVIRKFFNLDKKYNFEDEIVKYIKNLDWQEQNELMRKINKVLVCEVF